ncbi:MAG: hypothetical protein ACRDV8_10930 [Acidimicrobiales bacterium]
MADGNDGHQPLWSEVPIEQFEQTSFVPLPGPSSTYQCAGLSYLP